MLLRRCGPARASLGLAPLRLHRAPAFYTASGRERLHRARAF